MVLRSGFHGILQHLLQYVLQWHSKVREDGIGVARHLECWRTAEATVTLRTGQGREIPRQEARKLIIGNEISQNTQGKRGKSGLTRRKRRGRISQNKL